MNYWPAEPANLGRVPHDAVRPHHQPARTLAQGDRGREAVRDRLTGTSRGWAVRTSHGIHGDEGWQWDVPANAWYCQHFWMHYAFGGDKAWLRNVAYPVMKETCEFWEARLKRLPDGRLVVPNGWSPEHGPHEDGVSYCQQIVWDLFNNYVAASEALGVDADYRAKIAACATRCSARRSASGASSRSGWSTATTRMIITATRRICSPCSPASRSARPGRRSSPPRPGNRWSPAARTPDSDVREWSFAWRSALYARLRDGENAHRMVQSAPRQPQHLPEPLRPAPADADRRQLRDHRRHLRDAPAIACRRNRTSCRRCRKSGPPAR